MKKPFLLLVLACALFSRQAYAQFATVEELEVASRLGMEQPTISTKPGKQYKLKNLDYGMTIGIEQTHGGRIWNCWVGGGDNSNAYFLLAWSDDGGKKWTDTKMVIDPHGKNLPWKRRTIVGQLWLDPKGRLWLFFDQGLTYYDGRSTNWYSICENPDAKKPVWSTPTFLSWGCTLNKPTVASSGEWILPVSLWPRQKMAGNLDKGWTHNPFFEAYTELDSLRGAHAFVSVDEGRTWERRGMCVFPKPSFDEHLFVELKDGRWWMTARTGVGICQSFSSDKGYTWSTPEKYLPHVNARHFVMRLASGNLLLVKHGSPTTKTKKRSHLRAAISTDDGRTWKGNLLLDERMGISYPTGFQSPDGYIYISYDYERTKEGELYFAKFTEEDVLAKKIASEQGELKRLISKPGKVYRSAANVERKQQEQATP